MLRKEGQIIPLCYDKLLDIIMNATGLNIDEIEKLK